MAYYEYTYIINEADMVKEAETFWVTNFSNRNVSLADLALTIPAFSTVNLLDKKHYYYTLEQLQKSQSSGSLFNKRDKIKMRYTAPPVINKEIPILRDSFMPTKERSLFVIKEERYEELEISSEEYKKKDEEYVNQQMLEAEAIEAEANGTKPSKEQK